MKMKQLKKLLSLILCVALVAAVALSVIGCGDNSTGSGGTTSAVNGTGDVESPKNSDNVVGQGSKSFKFLVVDIDGNETEFVVKTDKDTVGAALLENGLIDGEDGDFGLYVKVVNGITADYDKDKTYWAFYVNGEYAMTGVDSTEITEGATYTFQVEK